LASHQYKINDRQKGTANSPLPLFVSVDSKRLSFLVTLLESTLAGGFVCVDSK
jgi:hypothetical protein